MTAAAMSPDDLARACADAMWKEDSASSGLGMEILDMKAGRATLTMTVKPHMVNGQRSWTQAVPLLRSEFSATPHVAMNIGGKATELTQGEQIAVRSPTNGEKAIAIDLFENQEENIDHSGLGDRGMFDRNVERFLYPPSITVISANSTRLSADDISRHGAIRFFSVDGGHTEAITLNDLHLAEQSIATGGIVALDDILHHGWTGVISGYVRYRQAGGKLRAFALVPNKLLLTDEGSAASYKDFMRTEFARFAGRQDMEFIGDIVDLYVPLPPPPPPRPGWLSRKKAKLRRKIGQWSRR